MDILRLGKAEIKNTHSLNLKEWVFALSVTSSILQILQKPFDRQRCALFIFQGKADVAVSGYIKLLCDTLDCLLPEEEAIVIDKTLERVSKASLEKLLSAEVYKVFPNKIADKKSCLILKPPKTTSSRRKAFFNSEIFREIDLRLAEIERNKQTLMSRYNDHNLLICRENGDPIEPQRLMDMFADWQDAHGTNYPRIVFHGLRHSATTYKMSISNGDVKSVQGDNGHSSADMTLNCYSHVEELRRKTLAKKVESSFYKTAREPEDKTEDESVDKLIEMALGNPQFQKKVLLALLSNTA